MSDVDGFSVPDREPAECDRCGSEIHVLEPATKIHFSGGVDALRTVCADCIEEIVDVWNEGAVDDTDDEQSDDGGDHG